MSVRTRETHDTAWQQDAFAGETHKERRQVTEERERNSEYEGRFLLSSNDVRVPIYVY